MADSESKLASGDWGEYCWLNDSCPPPTDNASTADQPVPGMTAFYIADCGTV